MKNRGDLMITKPIKFQNQIKRNARRNRVTRCIPRSPKWLQEFRENLVDDEIPVRGDSHASSSHEVSLEPTIKRREDLGEHSVYTHFPKDRTCEICKRTKLQGPHAEDAIV